MILRSKFPSYKIKVKGEVIIFNDYISVIKDDNSIFSFPGYGVDFWLDGDIKKDDIVGRDYKMHKNYDPFLGYRNVVENKNESVDIVVCVYNALFWTKKCIDSVKRFTAYPHRIIVVDDCSDEKTKMYLRGLKDIILLENSKNLGYLKSANRGLSYSKAKYVLFLNSDVVVTPYWLERMVCSIESDKKIGVADCVFDNGPILGDIVPEGKSFWDLWGTGFRTVDDEPFDIVNAVGSCMIIKREVIEKIGLFDEQFGFGYGEESDYCMRAIKQGYRVVKVPNVLVYHKHHGSQTSDEYDKRKREGLNRFMKLHSRAFNELNISLSRNVIDFQNKISSLSMNVKKYGKRIGFVTPHLAYAGGPRTIVETANDLYWRGYNTCLIVRNPGVISARNKFQCPVIYSPNLDNLKDFDLVVINEMDHMTERLFEYDFKKCLYILAHGEPSHELKDKVLQYPFDYAITTSKWLEDQIKNHKPKIKFPLERVGWRPYFYNHGIWPHREKFSDSIVTIATLQHDNKQKRFDKALAAFDEVRKKYGDKVRFVTFGYGAGGDRDYVEHYQDPSEKELNDIYNTADIFVVPSVTEGVGYTGMEAGMCKCAVVMANDNGGGEDYIVNGVTGIFKPVDKLGQGIIEFIENRGAAKKCGENLHAYIMDNYKDDVYLEKVEKVIVKLLNL